MTHNVGTVQILAPAIAIGPDTGAGPSAPNTWTRDFAHTPAATGTKFLILHFRNASLPANNRLEVDLGYGTDVFTAADGSDFWTRPVNIHVLAGGLVPIRYVTDGAATGSVELDKYGRGESLAGDAGHPSLSNCDPFLPGVAYSEPTYDPWWYCVEPPNWENIACVPAAADVRRIVARSVGMIVTVHGSMVSTCSVTLVSPDIVITAGHCVNPAADEHRTSSVIFNYEVDCGGTKPGGYSPVFHKVTESLHQQWNGFSGPDYCLLRLKAPPAGVPPVQVRHDVPAAGEQVFGVHHPNGAVKKLSLPHPGFDTVLGSNASAVEVHSNFHVSGGSSGSGLFDTAGRIVGVLSTGDPCGRAGAAFPLRYYPTASILTAIAPAPPPPVTRDVMVVFDRSGSMSADDGTGRSKIAVARDAVSLFVQLVQAGTGNRVGLVSFSTSASTPADFAIAPVTNANKNTLIGAAPYSGGIVGGLAPGGATSIGDGLDEARLQFPGPGTNPRAMLLLTDGLQNTPPMIDMVSGLDDIDINVVGFGTEANLDGPLLTDLATSHGGMYMRAGNGLALEKFFSQAFGNIFEAGILMDPEFELPGNQASGKPIPFNVCGEEAITAVAGWDRDDTTLLLQVTTPGGAIIVGGSPGVEQAVGRSWTFLKIPLPQGGERDGVWKVQVFRPAPGSEFPPAAPDLRYFINVIPTGGPRLLRVPDRTSYYTGDFINPMVMLRYRDGGWPHDATMRVTVSRPDSGVGNILSQSKLRPPVTLDGDTIPARQATLMALEAETGKPTTTYNQQDFDLHEDAASTRGTFEAGGVFGFPLNDLLTMEGDYGFHLWARYGEGCIATRELLWSVHVDVGIDPAHTDVNVVVTGTHPSGATVGTLTIVPRDRYGNHVGPGRAPDLSITSAAGTTLTGPVQDNGDGSYTVPATWEVDDGGPGVVVGQPGRPPVVVHPSALPSGRCRKWKLLACFLAGVVLLLLLLLIWSLLN